MQLIMEFYSLDFLVLMDYIEDIAVIDNPDNPSSIHLYQIKTKNSDKQYLKEFSQVSFLLYIKWLKDSIAPGSEIH